MPGPPEKSPFPPKVKGGKGWRARRPAPPARRPAPPGFKIPPDPPLEKGESGAQAELGRKVGVPKQELGNEEDGGRV